MAIADRAHVEGSGTAMGLKASALGVKDPVDHEISTPPVGLTLLIVLLFQFET